jgi:hypothetical protein
MYAVLTKYKYDWNFARREMGTNHTFTFTHPLYGKTGAVSAGHQSTRRLSYLGHFQAKELEFESGMIIGDRA